MKSYHSLIFCAAALAVLAAGNAWADTRPTLQSLQDQLNNTYTRQQVDNLLRKADPACFDNGNRYADCNNGTVTDSVTGLVWLKQADCLGVADYANANALAAALQSGQCGLADHSKPGDWRLPTEDEWRSTLSPGPDCRLPSLTNTAGTGCFVDGPQPFTGVQADVYWSATANLNAPNSAWSSDLHYGEEVSVNLTGHPNFVSEGKAQVRHAWPVRGVSSAQPLYETVIISAEVNEGIALADAVKQEIANYYAGSGVPANNAAVGLPPISGQYVTQVNIANGRIDISYGNNANAAIAGKTLSLTPYQTMPWGTVDWRCGNGRDWGGQLLGTGMGGLVAAYLPTLIDNRYLPVACRP